MAGKRQWQSGYHTFVSHPKLHYNEDCIFGSAAGGSREGESEKRKKWVKLTPSPTGRAGTPPNPI